MIVTGKFFAFLRVIGTMYNMGRGVGVVEPFGSHLFN